MIHHGNESYAVASSEAAAKARVKLEDFIQKNVRSANAVIERVESEVPTDKIITSDRLEIGAGSDGGYTLATVGGEMRTRLHDHAFRQVAQKTGVPSKYLTELAEHGE